MKLSRWGLSRASRPGTRELGILAWGTVALFGQCLHCLPPSPSDRSQPAPRLIPEPKDGSLSDLGDEFAGLSLHLNQQRRLPIVFTTESIAIAAIHAMKETALEEYHGILSHFDYTDILPPANPVRMVMVPTPSSFAAPLKRSTVLWTLKTFTIELMKMAILYSLTFKVKYQMHDLYSGMLTSPKSGFAVYNQSLSHHHPLSLTTAPLETPTSVSLKPPAYLQDHPHYQINFNLLGDVLSKIWIFESILTLLLQLAQYDYSTVLPRTSMELRQVLARIYIIQVSPPPPLYRFQQYHAVALLEAVARYYVLHGRYTEMTFELVMNGFLVASGCVTKVVYSRRWCRGMSPDGRADLKELVATS